MMMMNRKSDKKKERKIDKDIVSVLKNIRVYKKERDIEQQTNNQTRSVCMKKENEEESIRPRERTNSHTHTYTQHPSIRTSKRVFFFLYDHTKIHFSKKNVHIQEGYK